MKKGLFLIMSLCLMLCSGLFFAGCADGKDGVNGVNGVDGKSAYEIWLDAGNTGTEADFLNWLKGDNGQNGKSAYELYKQYHPDYNKTEEEFMQDLVNGELSTKEAENPQELAFYMLDDGTYGVSAGNAIYLSNIIIPDTYKGKPVTKIMESAFEDNGIIKSVIVGDNVKEIGRYAFDGCDHLLSVTLGTSVEDIDSQAFSNSNIAEIINKSNIADFGVISPMVVRTSGASQIDYVDGYAFMYYIRDEQDESYTQYKTAYYLLDYVGEDTELTLPTNYNGDNYVIWHSAFSRNEDITSLTINGGIEVIEGFSYCANLESVYIGGETAKEIDELAFYKCTSLENVEIASQTLEIINEEAFSNCNALESVILGSGVKLIGVRAFFGCSSLTSATFNNSGWFVAGNEDATSGLDIDVSDLATAARYLHDDYIYCYFIRNVEAEAEIE